MIFIPAKRRRLGLKEGFELNLAAANYSENKMEKQPRESPFGKALSTKLTGVRVSTVEEPFELLYISFD